MNREEVLISDNSGNYTIKGWFHVWENKVVLADNGQPFQGTFGLIEVAGMDAGEIISVDPTRIKFYNWSSPRKRLSDEE